MTAIHQIVALTRKAGRDAFREFFAPLTWADLTKTFHASIRAPTNSNLQSDAPISNDREDVLNRYAFSRRVAEGIKSVPKDSGFVISLEGIWGYGKTSALNLIEHAISQWPLNERPIVFRFNPWTIGSSETLVQTFLIQLAIVLEQSDQDDENAPAIGRLLDYSKLVMLLKASTRTDPWSTIGKKILASARSSESTSIKTLDLARHREAVISALLNLQRKVLIFVDDIDRLPPEEVFEIFRLVKAVGDFPNMTFVLCFDFNYVVSALDQHGISSPHSYLDKIVQTRLHLPKIDRDDLLKIFNFEYDTLSEDARKPHFPRQQERLSEIYYMALRQLFDTPRDIKRLFNRLRFTEPGCRGEVNIADLIGMEALALLAPTVYEHIKANPAAYIGRDFGRMMVLKSAQDVVKLHEEDRAQALNKTPSYRQKSIKNLLELLFPLISDHDRWTSSEPGRTNGLVSTPDRLAIALSAGLPSAEVSFALAVEFLNSPVRREEILSEVISSKKIERFLEHIIQAEKEATPADLHQFILSLGTLLDSPEAVVIERRQRDVFEASLTRQVWWAVEAPLTKAESGSRVSLLISIFMNERLLSLATEALTALQAQHGAFSDERAIPEKDRWLLSKDLEEVTDLWSANVMQAVRNRSLLSKTSAGHALYRLKKFRPKMFETVLKESFADKEFFDQLIEIYGHRGTDSSGGGYAKFESEDFEALGDQSALVSRAHERIGDPKVKAQVKNIYRAMISGKKVYIESGKIDEFE